MISLHSMDKASGLDSSVSDASTRLTGSQSSVVLVTAEIIKLHGLSKISFYIGVCVFVYTCVCVCVRACMCVCMPEVNYRCHFLKAVHLAFFLK